MKNLVIAGGGSAGWLTALFVKQLFPDHNVTLVQSSEIGTIGVGEATTPHLPNFLDSLKIHPVDIIPHIKGSIKNGISFENWNGDNKKYMHAFHDKIIDFQIPNIFDRNCTDYHHREIISKKLSMKEYLYQQKIAYENKVDIENVNWALHFDAKEFANYLQKIAIDRNIKLIDDEIVGFENDEKNFITKVILKNNRSVSCDFIFDCTGFRREIIGKFYKEKWKSYRSYMPMKKGIPFWLESKESLPSYTSSIALKNGWSWQIPLPHRTGSGYIFDSDYISVDEALNEAEEFYKQKLEVRKVIDFDPGRFENLWIKNCIAVGLSGSFLEPLESTSIWQTIDQLETLKHFLNVLTKDENDSRSLYNEMMNNSIDHKSYFIYLHYYTKRSDSDFWKEFKEKNPMPEELKNLYNSLKDGSFRYFDMLNHKTPGTFAVSSFTQVGYGLNMIDNLDNSVYNKIQPSLEEYKNIINYHNDMIAIDHRHFLERQYENIRNKF